MNMTEFKARIATAHQAGKLTNEQAQTAYAELSKKQYYGCAATPATRDRMLTNRFGV